MATVTTTSTPMRKLLNDPEQIVKDSLVGLAAAHGDVLRVDRKRNQNPSRFIRC
jgi:dihydroxyacetone kinase